MATRQARLRDSGERVVPEWIKPTDRMAAMLLDQHLTRYRTAALGAEGKRALDYGCGAGYGARTLAEGGAAAVTAVDVDPAAVDYARTHHAAPAVSFSVSDRVPPGTYDLVTCFEVLEHVSNPGDLLAAIREALTPEGRLYVSGCVYPTADMYRWHLRDYDRAALRDEVRRAGFTVVDELEQVAVMSAADVRKASLSHWRSFPVERFRRDPVRVLRRLVRTQLVQGVTHEEMMLVCTSYPEPDGPVEG